MKLPEGFKLDNSSQEDQPKLPPGFTLDNQEGNADSGGDYWGDVGKNAWEEAKQIPGGLMEAANTLSLPSIPQVGRSIFQASQGTPLSQTELGQKGQRQLETVKGMGQGIWQGVKDTGKTALMPLEMMSGTPASDTMAGKSFRQRPIGTTAGVASTVFPLMKAGRAAFASEGPNFLESAGARGMLKDAGIGDDTIGNLTPRGSAPGKMPANPVDVGEQLGSDLSQKGIVGGSGKSNFNNFMKTKMNAGQAVKDSAQAIRKANSGLGEYPELEDSLKVNSVPTLKPILDEANQIAQSGYDAPAARMLKRLYNNLQTKANGNQGFLTLDHVDEEMGHVGKLFGNAGRGTDKWNMVAKVYGKLAGIRDSMVTNIAEEVGNPELKNNFLKANSEYSKMMRIEPDIRSAANAEAVKSPFEGMKHPVDATHKLLSKGVYSSGRVARRIFEPMKSNPLKNQKGSIFPEEGEIPGKGQMDEFELADRENKGLKEDNANGSIDNRFAKYLNEHPTPASAFDFDRPGGHAKARQNPPNRFSQESRGSIYPSGGESKLPTYKPGQRTDPHAVFQGNMDFGDGNVYSTYILKGNHPRAGGNFGSEDLAKMGIPIVGAEGKGIGQIPDIFKKKS